MSAVDVLAVWLDDYVDASVQRMWDSDAEEKARRSEQARAAVAELIATMNEVDAYLAEREDVIDGDYGQPAPNAEMALRRDVTAALANVSPMTREQQAEQAGVRG